MNKLLSLLAIAAFSGVTLTATAATGPSIGGAAGTKTANPPPPVPVSQVQAAPTNGAKTGPSLQAAPTKAPTTPAPAAPATPFPSKTK